jgi:replicative DNA helicase
VNTTDLSGLALRLPPSNLEAEQALLGAIMANNQAFDRVAEIVQAEHFADAAHQRIFAALSAIIQRGGRADPVTLKNDLEGASALIEAGGIGYLAQLVGATVGIINAADYARAIRDAYIRRHLVELGASIVARAFGDDDESLSAEAQLERAEAALFSLADRGAADRPLVAAGAAAAEAVRLGQEAADRGGRSAGVQSGIAGVDRMIGAFPLGAMSVIAGRPAMGKSAMGLTIAARAANAGHRVLFASLEMRPDQIGARLVAAAADMAVAEVRKGGAWTQEDGGRPRFTKQNGHDRQFLAAAVERVAKLPLAIDYRPGLSVAQLRARCRRERRRGGLDLVIVDYLGLMQSSEAVRRHGNRVQQVGELSRDLTLLAGDLGVPVVVMAQLNRAVETRDSKAPMMSDLRDSGEIEQDAEVIAFLYREHYYLTQNEPKQQPKETTETFANRMTQWANACRAAEGRAELIIAKNRQDRTGPVRLRFLAERTWFADETEHDPIAPFGAERMEHQ